ncbi:hypothetical protein AB0L10_30630 [Streptomyces flaveolus]|uniref:hypothetical protein n=1 Tax=Streptomyces flaveolus TaxID=67297 RepID=UPI003438DB9E
MSRRPAVSGSHREPRGGDHAIGGIPTGIAAGVANAVFDATGRRVRDLPITPEKLLGPRM